jgi:hypothetical protein
MHAFKYLGTYKEHSPISSGEQGPSLTTAVAPKYTYIYIYIHKYIYMHVKK